MTPVLWKWPETTRVGKVVPKNKFYEMAKVSSRLRDAFVNEVERIIWGYKLAPQTLSLAASPGVPEIQVFLVEAKADREVSGGVLSAIDSSVHTPIIFEEQRDGLVRTIAAFKEAGPKAPKIGVRMAGEWDRDSAERTHLPPARDLGSLYRELLQPLMPLTPRPGESLPEALGRIEQARSIEREVEALKRKLAQEPQLNRKLDIRRELMQRTAEYEALVAEVTE
jgi:hypothetical protein